MCKSGVIPKFSYCKSRHSAGIGFVSSQLSDRDIASESRRVSYKRTSRRTSARGALGVALLDYSSLLLYAASLAWTIRLGLRFCIIIKLSVDLKLNT